mgnify:CR=1 FL=1
MQDTLKIFDRDLLRRRRDRAAATFNAHSFLICEVGKRLSDRLLDMARHFPRTLDLGARSGGMGPQSGGNGGIEIVVSADISPSLLSRAPGWKVATDAEFLPFIDNAFDLVFSNLDLHWTNDLPGSLIQVRRVLKPDGLFLGAIFGGNTLSELRNSLMTAELELTGGASPRISPFTELRDAGGLLQRAGFALPVADTDKIVVTYENMFRLMSDLRGMAEGNMLVERKRQPTSKRLFIRAAELYAEQHAEEDGRIRATFEIVYLHGWAPHVSQPKALRPGSATTRLAEALQSSSDERQGNED